VTDTTSKLIGSLQRSWLLKLVWIWAPFTPLVFIALSKHDTGRWTELASAAMILLLFGGLAASYGLGLIDRRQRRARRRKLPPLQRMQVSEETNLVPLSETFRITDHPPIGALPRPVQLAVAFWGAPLPKPLTRGLLALDLFLLVLLMTMVMVDDPMGEISRRLDTPLLPYWPVFCALVLTLILLRTYGRLSQMHRHYAAEAAASGRRPFPAL
jgi:hypothetical protein